MRQAAISKKNQFTEDFAVFMKTSVDLIHLLTFLLWQFQMAKSTVKRSVEMLEKQRAPKDCFGPMTGSSIINIFHDGVWVTRAPGGKRMTIGKDVNRMATEVEGRFSASAIGALHTAWKEYVKRRYEDSSLRYMGVSRHKRMELELFDTALTEEDFKATFEGLVEE